MNLLSKLKNVGFSTKESQIYLQLIHAGPQSASELSRMTGINRTSVYDIIEGLKKRGILKSIKIKSSTLFQALHPKELINFLEREKEETVRRLEKQQSAIEEMLPELISLEQTTTSKPKITFYEGEKGMREAYEDTLNAESEILAYANVAAMHETLPHFFPEYYKRRAIEKKIHIKAILPDNAAGIDRSQKDADELRESRLVPEKDYGFSPELNIYNNKILITSWKEQLSILIESAEIAELHRKIFQLSWERAGRDKN